MMAAARSKQLEALKGGDLEVLLKKTFSTVGPGSKALERLLVGPADEVVELFEEFFKEVAVKGNKLTKTDLKKLMAGIHKYDALTLEQIAGKLVLCSRYVYKKSKEMKTGTKLPDGVRRVAKMYRRGSSDVGDTPPQGVLDTPQSTSGSKCSGVEAEDMCTAAEEELEKAKGLWNVGSPERPFRKALLQGGYPIQIGSPTNISIASSPGAAEAISINRFSFWQHEA